MAANLKNANKLQGLLLAHGEKLVVAIAAAGAAFLMYAATGQEGFADKPRDLRDLADDSSRLVEGCSWSRELDPTLPTADQFQPAAADEVPPDTYAISTRGWNRPVVPPVVLRRDPKLLPPVELEGHGYTTLLAFYSSEEAKENMLKEERDRRRDELRRKQEAERNAENGGLPEVDGGLSNGDDPNRRPIPGGNIRAGITAAEGHVIRISPCAIVTAKAPLKEQWDIYLETLENALGYDPTRDLPIYLGYFVQRAEVVPGQPMRFTNHSVRNPFGSGTLSAVSEEAIDRSIADWAEVMEDPISPEYYDPSLTYPLPPRVGADWGPEVVHSGVPTAAEAEAKAAREEEATLNADGGTAGGELPLFGGSDEELVEGGENRRRIGSTRSRRPRIGGPGRVRPGGGRPRGGRPRGGLAVGRRSTRGRALHREGHGGPREHAEGAGDYGPPCVMLRFVDFDVQPGRQYAYRFRLALLDVNGKGQVSASYLEKEVKQRVEATTATPKPFVTTEWSEPTPPVAIPLAGGIALAGVSPSRTGEPTASILVQSFGRDPTGDAVDGQVLREKVRLGSVMNFTEEDVWIRVPGQPYEEKFPEFSFLTGVTLLDVEGGEDLSRTMRAPGSALVMGPNGRLRVHRELEDSPEVQAYRLRNEQQGPGGASYGGEGFFEGSYRD